MDPKIAAFRVEGLCAAHFQPFSAPDGTGVAAVDHAPVARHVEELVRQKVSAVFVCGTTAEGVKCSVAERKAILEAWVAAARPAGLVVIAHVGAESVADAVDLAAHAVAAGASAAGLVAPSYFRPGDVGACVSLLSTVGAACPSLPLYWYHIPSMSGVLVRADLVLRAVSAAQAAGRCANVRGVKFSDTNLHVYANCVALEGGKFDCPYGCDEQGLGALAMGARGFIGSTYNYSGRVAADMIAAFRAGDLAGAHAAQRRIQNVVDLLFASSEYGPPGCNVGKAIMELRLGGMGCGPARAPGYSVSDGGREKLRADLEKIGFFTW